MSFHLLTGTQTSPQRSAAFGAAGEGVVDERPVSHTTSTSTTQADENLVDLSGRLVQALNREDELKASRKQRE